MKRINKNISIFLLLVLMLTTIVNAFDIQYSHANPINDGWELIAENSNRLNNTYFNIMTGYVFRENWNGGLISYIDNFYYGTIDLINYEYMYDGVIFRNYGTDGTQYIKGSSSSGGRTTTQLYRRPTTVPKPDLLFRFNGIWQYYQGGGAPGTHMPSQYNTNTPSYITFKNDNSTKYIRVMGNITLSRVYSIAGERLGIRFKYYDKNNSLITTKDQIIPMISGGGQVSMFNISASNYYGDIAGSSKVAIELFYLNEFNEYLYYYSKTYSWGGFDKEHGQFAYIGEFVLNNIPELTLLKPINNLSLATEPELSGFTVEGYVRDKDNDTLTVTVEVAGVSKSITVSNTSVAKSFTIPFDVIQDEIRQGTHKLIVTAKDPGGGEDKKEVNIIVKSRIKNGSYVLINEPVLYQTIYQDPENDPKYQEQYKFTHNPNYFENSMGIISDSGMWRTGTYNSFEKTGLFEGVYRARDNPKANNAFDEFRKWSRESLGMIEFKVHRVPIPMFTIKTTPNPPNYSIIITDSSYDLDHQSKANKGIIDRKWQWKNINSINWTDGMPPSSLPPNQSYLVRLKVRDQDGLNGLGVWSDWLERHFNTNNTHLPPVAQFEITPNKVSHNPSKIISIKDYSYSPKGYALTYEWIVTNKSNGQIIYNKSSMPTSSDLKKGIGIYDVRLRVRDSLGTWSEPYTQSYEIVNYPPQAKFTAPEEVYRDTIIKPVNLSTDEDGDNITYDWYVNLDGTDYFINKLKDPSFTIQQIIKNNNLSPIKAISDNWMIKLKATDPLGAFSIATEALNVINHKPIAVINGLTTASQYTNNSYNNGSYDSDTADNPLAVYRWKHIKPDGSIELWNTKDINVYFDIPGKHTIEHWVIDQIGEISDVDSIEVNVIENKAPKMNITSPSGTITKPTIVPGDPLMEWTYTDPESDPQEKYSFDFYYADDDILVKSLTNSDSTGNIRKHQMPNNTFERFRVVKGVGRTYSKYKWSELSNIIYFIINDAPVPGFTLDKNIVVRGEEINVISTAYDPNEEQGDTITHKYYIKKLPDGAETLYTSLKDFTLSINTLTANRASDQYQIRQVVTDTLGVSSEHKETITVANQKANVDILEPSSSNSSSPTSFSELRPTIKWSYLDLDGDIQKKYKVTIYSGATNNIVTTSGEITSANKYWTVSSPLVEDILYSVTVEVYDGHEWSISERKYFKVFSLKVSGHLLPNPAMAGDKIYFYITTEGYADKIEIVVPNDLIAMDNRVSMGYPAVTYPSIFFNVDKTVMKKEDILEYIVWISTEDTLNKSNVRLRQPYKFIVRAYKGTVTREIELELDVKGSILELLKPGIKNKNGK